MKKKHRFLYFVFSFGFYCLLAFIDFFVLNRLLDVITESYFFHMIVFIVCLLVVNPIITYLLLNLLPFKPQLRLKGNINEDLKSESM